MSGPWTVERDGRFWRISRPGGGVSLLRATREDAEKARDHENIMWADRNVRRAGHELLAALKAIKDQTIAVQHSQETRLNDIYDIATAAINKAEGC